MNYKINNGPGRFYHITYFNECSHAKNRKKHMQEYVKKRDLVDSSRSSFNYTII